VGCTTNGGSFHWRDTFRRSAEVAGRGSLSQCSNSHRMKPIKHNLIDICCYPYIIYIIYIYIHINISYIIYIYLHSLLTLPHFQVISTGLHRKVISRDQPWSSPPRQPKSLSW
jgi:hypothetical protein